MVNRSKSNEIVYVGIFAALIALCSWISIPGPVPFTMQTMAVFLTVGLLGGRLGSMAVLVYILMGAVGLPVFSHFQGGLGMLLGTAVLYALGTAWFCQAMDSPLGAALSACVIPFLPGDLAKIVVSMLAGPVLRSRLRRAGLCPQA